MSKAGQDEARKSTAAFLNGIALLVLGAGCVSPAVARVQEVGWSMGLVATSVLAMALHAAGRRLLREMQD